MCNIHFIPLEPVHRAWYFHSNIPRPVTIVEHIYKGRPLAFIRMVQNLNLFTKRVMASYSLDCYLILYYCFTFLQVFLNIASRRIIVAVTQSNLILAVSVAIVSICYMSCHQLWLQIMDISIFRAICTCCDATNFKWCGQIKGAE